MYHQHSKNYIISTVDTDDMMIKTVSDIECYETLDELEKTLNGLTIALNRYCWINENEEFIYVEFIRKLDLNHEGEWIRKSITIEEFFKYKTFFKSLKGFHVIEVSKIDPLTISTKQIIEIVVQYLTSATDERDLKFRPNSSYSPDFRTTLNLLKSPDVDRNRWHTIVKNGPVNKIVFVQYKEDECVFTDIFPNDLKPQ